MYPANLSGSACVGKQPDKGAGVNIATHSSADAIQRAASTKRNMAQLLAQTLSQ